jgi:hypothetical protein
MENVAVGDFFYLYIAWQGPWSNFFKFVSLKNYFAKKQQHLVKKIISFFGG